MKRGRPALIRGFRRDEQGSVAVEGAIAGAMLSLVLVQLADVSLMVTDQQRMQAGLAAGADYLHGVAGDENYSAFSDKTSSEMSEVKKIIRDASGLSINADDVTVDMGCGCVVEKQTGTDAQGNPTYRYAYDMQTTLPALTVPALRALRGTDPLSDMSSPVGGIATGGVSLEPVPVRPDSDGTCPVTCSSGDPATLADIRVKWGKTDIRGQAVTRAHELRIRVK